MTNPNSLAATPNVVPHLIRMHPSYAATFTDVDIQRHTFWRTAGRQHLVEVEAVLRQPTRQSRLWSTLSGGTLPDLRLLFATFLISGWHVFTYDPPSPIGHLALPERRRSRRQHTHPKNP